MRFIMSFIENTLFTPQIGWQPFWLGKIIDFCFDGVNGGK